MKSHLFSTHDVTRSKTFEKDFKVLLSFEENTLLKLIPFILDVSVQRGETEREDAQKRASKEVDLPRATLDHALDIGIFFLDRITSDEEGQENSPDDLAYDLVHIGFAADSDKSKLISFFNSLKEVSTENYNNINRQQLFVNSSAPILTEIGSTINYRVIFNKPYKSNIEIEDYEPKCEGIVPIALIELGLSERSDNIFFQADKRNLKLLINHLLSIEKEFNVSQKYLDLDSGKNNG